MKLLISTKNRIIWVFGVFLFLFGFSSLLFISNTKRQRRQEAVVNLNPKQVALVNDKPIKACFVVLVRNSELDGILSTMLQLEHTFNSKFNYPYVFLNDDDFTEEFKERTSSVTKAKTNYGKLDSQMWGYPDFINQTFAAESREAMALNNVPYATSESYRHMCR